MANKTPDEILEEQRAERSREYAANIHYLHLKEMDVQSKIDNLQKTLDEAFSNRKKELDALEQESRDRIAHFDNKSAELSSIRKEAEVKLAEANDILSKAKSDAGAHQENLDKHLNSVDEQKLLLSNKSSQLDVREAKTIELEAQAKFKFEAALKKEKEIEEQSNNLVHISNNTNDDIKKQKEIYEKNRLQIEELNRLNAEFINLQNKNSEDLANLIVERDSLENEKKSQINRKLEISQREEELQQKNVKYALDLQRLQDKEKETIAQIGKLNQLKNNVESLMKLQGKGAENGNG